jgi:opacity protein-like surface antigen
MRRASFWACVAVPMSLLLLAWPQAGNASLFEIKIYGGYNYLDGGDLNVGMSGWLEAYKELGGLWGVNPQGDYQPFHGGLDIGGDLILHITPIVGIGLGGGLIQVGSNTEVTFPGGQLRLKPRVTVIPLRAGIYFSLPVGSLVSLSLNGGAEYYLAKFKYTNREEGPTYWKQSESNLDSRGKVGFFGGAGIEIKLSRNISFLLEGRGRIGRVDGFEGEHVASASYYPTAIETVKLWYANVNLPFQGWHKLVFLSNVPIPPLPDFQDVRLARLDLKGFSALGGLVFRF